MKKLFFIWLITSALAQAQTPVEKFSWGDFGETHIYFGGTRALELVLTDSANQAAAEQLAAHLSQRGQLSAVLNMDSYLSHIEQRKARCFDAATPLSVYAQDLQQNHQFNHFEPAFITGLGSAGSYLFTMLSQVPAGLFRGAFSTRLDTQVPLAIAPCKTSPAVTWTAKTRVAGLNEFIPPTTPWRLFNNFSEVNNWLKSAPLMNNWQLARAQADQDTRTQASSADTSLAQLPLVELPADSKGPFSRQDFMALVISGDGGWANIDKDIANQLSSQGVPVVGWNSLNYFWEGKTPAIAAQDLQQVLDHYRALWHKNKVMLIGYSMGADVMPFMVNGLNPQTQEHILSVNLLNPSTSVDFTFHLSGWLNSASEDPYKTYEQVVNWHAWQTNCFYSETDESLCAELKKLDTLDQQQIHLYYRPGDHHFDGNYRPLIDLILTHSGLNLSSTTTQSPAAP